MARRNDDHITDGIVHIFRHVPWWVGPPAAIGVFALFGYALPALFGLVTPSGPQDIGRIVLQALSAMSRILGPMLGLFVAALWILALVERRRDRHRFDAQTGIKSIRDMPWQQFESLLAEHFRRLGYSAEPTPDGPDGGVDLILRQHGQVTIVQAKHWNVQSVGVRVVRELLGVKTAERATDAILVTSGHFTADAREFARAHGVRLIDGDALEPLIRAVQNTIPAPRRPLQGRGDATIDPSPTAPPAPASRPATDQAPPCPDCGAVTTKKVAKRGRFAGQPFWGCPRYPDCKGMVPMR